MYGNKISELLPELDHSLLEELGLNITKITSHYKKIQHVLQGDQSTLLPIVDVCNTENGTILSWKNVSEIIKNIKLFQLFKENQTSQKSNWMLQNVITCIPAAGAGSRFWSGISAEVVGDKKDLPKAFLPATSENDTFLEIKLLESQFLLKTQFHVFIAPHGYAKKFMEQIKRAALKFKFQDFQESNHLVLEQHHQLASIRFKLDGTPLINEDKSYSQVPAGHGELLHLFDDIVNQFPNSRSIHLRNIDNVIGNSPKQAQEIEVLAQSYEYLQKAIDILREGIKECLENPHFEYEYLNSHLKYASAIAFLKEMNAHLFPDLFNESVQDWHQLFKNVHKPLSVFGVVKKEANDQGGGPVFAQLPNGQKTVICLEESHVSEKDKKEYFDQNGKLKFFNPVLVFFEARHKDGTTVEFQNLFDENFWLLSKRKFGEEDVCYHETVLYELIGNAEKTNLVFIEVPRSLFNPNKYYQDSKGKSRKDYSLEN